MLHVICLVVYAASSVAGLVLSMIAGPLILEMPLLPTQGFKPFLIRPNLLTLSAMVKLKSVKGFHLVQTPYQTPISRETLIFHSIV